MFHSFSPATDYALLPYVLRLAMGSSSNWLLEDLNYIAQVLISQYISDVATIVGI